MMIIQCIDTVVFPFSSAPEPVRYAAEELCRCLAGMQGQAPQMAETAAGFSVSLGWDAPHLPGGAFAWDASKGGISLYAGTPQGVVYGVYGLLEEMGCRFLARDCEVLPPLPCEFPEGNHREAPAFRVRELFWREAMDGDFAVKLRLNSARSSITPRQGGKAMFYNFSHTFNQLVPASRYFDAHPEYFSMVDGQRKRERTQLCLTNPDVLALCVQGVKTWAREHPDYNIFSVAMNDWYQPCCCPDCARIDAEEESQAGTMIRFVNRVAEEVEKEFPHVMIHTFAYLYCRKPPKLARPRHNVIVRLCSIECCFAHPIASCGCESGGIDVQYGAAHRFHGDRQTESAFMRDLKGWSRICDNLYIWDYTTNYANYALPFPNLPVLQENLRTFRRWRVKGMFEQGNFSLGRATALGQLKIYLLAKWMWNPDLEGAALIHDFLAGYYGPGAERMSAYVALWQGCCGKDDHAGIYDGPDAGYFTDALLEKAQEHLRQALEEAPENPYRERIEREMLSVRYAMLTRLPLQSPDRNLLIDQFAQDAQRLGVTELFERKSLASSIQVMKESRYALDRSHAQAISYPL